MRLLYDASGTWTSFCDPSPALMSAAVDNQWTDTCAGGVPGAYPVRALVDGMWVSMCCGTEGSGVPAGRSFSVPVYSSGTSYASAVVFWWGLVEPAGLPTVWRPTSTSLADSLGRVWRQVSSRSLIDYYYDGSTTLRTIPSDSAMKVSMWIVSNVIGERASGWGRLPMFVPLNQGVPRLINWVSFESPTAVTTWGAGGYGSNWTTTSSNVNPVHTTYLPNYRDGGVWVSAIATPFGDDITSSGFDAAATVDSGMGWLGLARRPPRDPAPWTEHPGGTGRYWRSLFAQQFTWE